MKKFPWSPILPLLFLFLSTGIHVVEPTFVEQMRHRVFDEYQRLKPRVYSNDIPVRILDIDNIKLMLEYLSTYGNNSSLDKFVYKKFNYGTKESAIYYIAVHDQVYNSTKN